jgi:hypothetical protein
MCSCSCFRLRGEILGPKALADGAALALETVNIYGLTRDKIRQLAYAGTLRTYLKARRATWARETFNVYGLTRDKIQLTHAGILRTYLKARRATWARETDHYGLKRDKSTLSSRWNTSNVP